MAKTRQQKLDEAEAALHDLMLGESARVVVDQNGERIEYTAANAGKLRAYIAELKALLNPRTPTGPMRVFY